MSERAHTGMSGLCTRKAITSVGLENGLVVKSTRRFSRRLGFNTQHLHSSSQPFISLVPGNLPPSSGPPWVLHTGSTQTFMQ